MDMRDTLQKVCAEGVYIDLTLEYGRYSGFVLAVGPELVLMQVVDDYRDDGALVATINQVKACDVSRWAGEQLKILDFNSIKRTKRYGWVRINNLPTLFKSLKLKGKFVVLTAAGEDGADVGRIDEIEDTLVVLKGVDPGGNWEADEAEWPYDDITLIEFDDSYSRVLQRYVERPAPLK